MRLIQHIYAAVSSEMSSAGIFLLRLVLAALPGGAIRREREFKHRSAGLLTNLGTLLGPVQTE